MTRLLTAYRNAQCTTYRLLTVGQGGQVANAVDAFIAGLIVANVVAVALGTVDPVFARYRGLLYRFNVVSVVVFTVEYVLRVWSATAADGYSHPVFGRLRYMVRPECIVDLLAIAPFYVGLTLFGGDGRLLRGFRLIRFFRLAKLVRYTDSITRFERVLRHKTDDLVVALGGTTLLVVCSSSLMYFVEHDAQPDAFSSIPAAVWWGVVTLTTVGYGDVYPVTPLGKLLGGVVAVLGTGLVALPASILASGFIHDDAKPSRCPHCDKKLD